MISASEYDFWSDDSEFYETSDDYEDSSTPVDLLYNELFDVSTSAD